MVDICKFTEDTLKQLNIPYYCGMPDFSNDEPPNYIVYDFYDTPECFADNEETCETYHFTVNIFTQGVQSDLFSKVKHALKSAGFVYNGSSGINVDTLYPNRHRQIQEYTIIF